MKRLLASFVAPSLIALLLLAMAGASALAGRYASDGAPAALPCHVPTPSPTPGPSPPSDATPTPAVTFAVFCNFGPQAASDLHVRLITGGYDPHVVLLHNASGCDQPAITTSAQSIVDLVWPSACVQGMDAVILELGSCSQVCAPPQVWCYWWTLFGAPIPVSDVDDADHDGVPDTCDNCPTVPNPDQVSTKHIKLGDACDSVPGDVNCDFSVDAVDALLVLHHVAGVPPDARCISLFGDAHCDGSVDTVDVVDALWILRHVAGFPVQLGCGK